MPAQVAEELTRAVECRLCARFCDLRQEAVPARTPGRGRLNFVYGFRWIDTTNPQHWRCEVPPEYTVEEFSAEFDRATEALRQLPDDFRFVYLADMSAVPRSDPRNRARVARFLSESNDAIKRHMIAWGIVVGNSLLQGAVTAVSWLGSFPVPTRVFTDRRACADWLDQQLALEQLAQEASSARRPSRRA